MYEQTAKVNSTLVQYNIVYIVSQRDEIQLHTTVVV